MQQDSAGWVGIGNWKVTIYRGTHVVLKIKSNAMGVPSVGTWIARPGDRVRVVTLSPGSFVQVGHS